MPMLYADDYVSPRRGFRDPLRMTQSAHVCSEFRSSGETKTFKPFKTPHTSLGKALRSDDVRLRALL